MIFTFRFSNNKKLVMPKNQSAKTSARKLNETIFAKFSIRSFFFFILFLSSCVIVLHWAHIFEFTRQAKKA